MSNVALADTRIAPMAPEAIQLVRDLEALTEQLPQVDIETDHVLHAGMYARTIRIPAGVVLTGALIEVDTVLIVQGDTDVFIGGDTVRLTGYHVLQASKGRKQAFYAHADTYVTMVFPSQASTVEQAENEFTNEADRLLSRRQQDTQGEHLCQEQ